MIVAFSIRSLQANRITLVYSILSAHEGLDFSGKFSGKRSSRRGAAREATRLKK